jgi:hypothetical protein
MPTRSGLSTEWVEGRRGNGLYRGRYSCGPLYRTTVSGVYRDTGGRYTLAKKRDGAEG